MVPKSPSTASLLPLEPLYPKIFKNCCNAFTCALLPLLELKACCDKISPCNAVGAGAGAGAGAAAGAGVVA